MFLTGLDRTKRLSLFITSSQRSDRASQVARVAHRWASSQRVDGAPKAAPYEATHLMALEVCFPVTGERSVGDGKAKVISRSINRFIYRNREESPSPP